MTVYRDGQQKITAGTMEMMVALRQNWRFIISLTFFSALFMWKFGIETLSTLAFLCMALLFLMSIIFKSNKTALVIILTLAFSRGIMLLAGIPTIVPRSIMEISILLLLVKSLYLRSIVGKRSIKVLGFLPLLALFIVSLFSLYINKKAFFPYLFFLRDIFVYYLLFIALLNLDLAESTLKDINKYIVFLFLIQIPAAITKFIIIGLEEGRGIGTVSVYAGSLSVTLPLFAMAFLFSLYFFRKRNIYLFGILAFIAFSLMGQKRALAFYLPLLALFLYYNYGKGVFHKSVLVLNRRQIKVIVLIGLISLSALYFTAKTQYFLNPEDRIGGSFDMRYISKKVNQYMTEKTYEGHTLGRLATTIHSYDILRKEGPLTSILGLGAGILTASSLMDRDLSAAYLQLGILGGKTGLVWLLLQVGILGVFFLLLFYFQLYRRAYIVYKHVSDPYWKPIILGFMGVTFVFVLDFVTYSVSSMFLGILTPVYFYLAAACFKAIHFEKATL